ncbi:hypothetical protein PGTUg99_032600 [Puccinia graminis f. sp. tritici]|uniref:Uncharacterized protein n=1 Tax=Puccinia graminis f. sp. tritici TaxID=56615 RepID=A0A5B0RGC7_PUCGR|nr:hypothetical protein PGTUg99_032600 [Puccinia graminis f. sp. tritici]
MVRFGKLENALWIPMDGLTCWAWIRKPTDTRRLDSPSFTVRQLCKAENGHHPPNWTQAPTQAQAEL